MLEAYALTDPGRVRTNNQDFFRIVPELGLYLLADGMGGARGGERASRLAVECVAETLANSHDLAIASVGDSRAYLFRQGALRTVTEDQTWVQEVGRPLGLNEESLKTHPMRHVLTMAVGVGVAIRIRYYAVQLTGADIMMLSSDGLHGVIGESNIGAILGDSNSLEQKCRDLIDAAHENGSPDNITVVLIRIAA